MVQLSNSNILLLFVAGIAFLGICSSRLQQRLPESIKHKENNGQLQPENSSATEKDCPDIPMATQEGAQEESTTSYWTRNITEESDFFSYHYQPSPNASFQTIQVPNQEPFMHYPLSSILANASNPNISIVFYGSSYVRELYFALVRLERGIKFNAPLEHTVKYVASGSPKQNQSATCDPRYTQHVDGLYGVDLEGCGPPGRRIVPELSGETETANNKVAIGFKTFLHTPDAEQHFVDFLTSHNLRHPTVLVVDLGIWGTRGQKMGGPKSPSTNMVMEPLEEIDYYFDWIQNTFPKSKVVYIAEEPPNLLGGSVWEETILPRMKEKALQTKRHHDVLQGSFIIRKDFIQRVKLKKRFPCGHGCAGPVTMAVAILLLDWLSAISSGPNKCI